MKNFLSVLAAFLFLMTLSCDKIFSPSSDPANALKDGNEWEGDHAVFIKKPASKRMLHIRLSSENDQDQLDFTSVPFQIGEYDLVSSDKFGNSNGLTTVGLVCVSTDIIYCWYRLDSLSKSAFISIDEISSDSLMIQGRFQASFQIEEDASGGSRSKSVAFSEGTYSANLQE